MAETGDIPTKSFACTQSPESDSLTIEREFDNLGEMMIETTTNNGRQRWPVWLGEEQVIEVIHVLVDALNKRGHKIEWSQ